MAVAEGFGGPGVWRWGRAYSEAVADIGLGAEAVAAVNEIDQ